MKRFAYSIGALALLATSASAADIYGGLKDGASTPAIASSVGRGGWYGTGFVGYSWGDRDIRANSTRELGIYADMKEPVEADFNADGAGELTEEERAEFEDAQAKHKECLDELLAASPLASYDGTTATIPLIGDLLSNAGNSDADGFVFGAELSRLWHSGGRFGFEAAVGATFYTDDKSDISWNGAHGVINQSAFPGLEGLPVAQFDPNGVLGQTGFASAERQFDIDLIGRGYYFATPNLALTLGAGVSFAKAEICAASSTDGVALLAGNPQLHSFADGAFNHSGCDDDWSIGPMGEVGFKYWATERVSIVGRVDAKWHEFSGRVGSSAKLGEAIDENCCNVTEAGLYGKSGTDVDVDDVKWSAKLGVSIKLD